jgi:hypothetical protein
LARPSSRKLDRLPRRRLLTRTVPALLLLGFALLFMHDLLTHRRELLHPDIYTVYYPFRTWFAQRLADRELPLWNPYWGIGHPAEVWSSIPLDLYTPFEIALGSRYEWLMLLQALVLLGVATYSLRRLGAPTLVASTGAILFFLSPWVSYFFLYFILGSSFVAHILLFLFAYLWLETRKARYLVLIAAATSFGMLGTKLDLWLVQCAHFALFVVAGAVVLGGGRLRDSLRASAGALGAMLVGIATQTWQLAILLPTLSESGRAASAGLASILSSPLYHHLAASVPESVLVQLAVFAGLLYSALATRRRQAVALSLAAVMAFVFFLTLDKGGLPREPVTDTFTAEATPTVDAGSGRSGVKTAPSSRDGTFASFWQRFAAGPVGAGVLVALGFAVWGLRDRNWRAHARSSLLFLLFAYYYCRYTRGDLGEVMILDSAPAVFKLGLAAFVWLGCRQMAEVRVARLAYVSALCVFVMRDQGQILLAHLTGIQWVPTRDNFIVDWAFAVLAVAGLAALVSTTSRTTAPSERRWVPGAAALAVIVATILSVKGDLLYIHPLIGDAPRDSPYFDGVPSLRALLAQLRDGPTTRVFFANDEFMEFHHVMGSSLLEGVGQVSLYSSMGSARYREWTTLQRLGIRPEERWRGWSNETTAGTARRLPRVRDLGHPNSEVYKYTVINRPALDRDTLAFLGVRYAIRLYPVDGSYRIEDGEPEAIDEAVRRLDPLGVRLITGRVLGEPANPMYLAELSGSLPRAFVLANAGAEAEMALRRELRPRLEAATLIAGTARLPWRPAAIIRYDPENVEVEAESDGESVLVLADLFHPFWRVSVDGQPGEIFPVFSVLRGVRLPPGRHTVSFTCVVPRMPLAWAITASALLAITLAWVATRYRPAPNGSDGAG